MADTTNYENRFDGEEGQPVEGASTAGVDATLERNVPNEAAREAARKIIANRRVNIRLTEAQAVILLNFLREPGQPAELKPITKIVVNVCLEAGI